MNFHKLTPLLLSAVLLGLIQLASINSGPVFTDVPASPYFSGGPGQLQIRMAGNLGNEDYVAVQDTLLAWVETIAPEQETGTLNWGVEQWFGESGGKQDEENFEFWADLSFEQGPDMHDWLRKAMESANFKIEWGKFQESAQFGFLDFSLPLAGHPGRSLHLENLEFAFRMV